MASQAVVTVLTQPNQPATQFTSALAYLRAICPGSLPRTIEDCLKNDDELRHFIPSALLDARPVRELEFTPGITPNNFLSFGTYKPFANIGALLVYITGVWQPGTCESSKKFARCVIPDGSLSYADCWPLKNRQGSLRETDIKWTACANHHYDGEWSRCPRRPSRRKRPKNGQASTIQATDPMGTASTAHVPLDLQAFASGEGYSVAAPSFHTHKTPAPSSQGLSQGIGTFDAMHGLPEPVLKSLPSQSGTTRNLDASHDHSHGSIPHLPEHDPRLFDDNIAEFCGIDLTALAQQSQQAQVHYGAFGPGAVHQGSAQQQHDPFHSFLPKRTASREESNIMDVDESVDDGVEMEDGGWFGDPEAPFSGEERH